ncbi:MAG: DUF4331 domain-containing protein, partial [Segetibacter sp.]|nr:DUF4331 domain-containing protein [Segetibacter sp.]
MKRAAIGCMFLASGLMASQAFASSHREAPMIAFDPVADNTDLYAFRSPDNPNTITIIANYIPAEHPFGGPNYHHFGENVRYEIHIDNDLTTVGDDIVYRFTFNRMNEDPTTFFLIRLGAENLRTTYMMEKSTDGGASFTTVIDSGYVPAPNVGPRSIESETGLGTTYSALMMEGLMMASSGETVFCGPVDDPFFVDLGGAFDVANLPRMGENPRDGLAK